VQGRHHPHATADSTPTAVRLWTNARLHGALLPDAEAVNRRIAETFSALREPDFTRRTHFFGGRFENLYVERERIPALAPVLHHAQACARQILGRGPRSLRIGFWLNAQGPGQSTSEHTHEELDELLSGVYYVQVPPGSGDLLLRDGHFRVQVTPVAGMFVFFPPNLPHSVEANGSDRQRLSIAFNFGPGTA
jgi:hypothetical protein